MLWSMCRPHEDRGAVAGEGLADLGCRRILDVDALRKHGRDGRRIKATAETNLSLEVIDGVVPTLDLQGLHIEGQDLQ